MSYLSPGAFSKHGLCERSKCQGPFAMCRCPQGRFGQDRMSAHQPVSEDEPTNGHPEQWLLLCRCLFIDQLTHATWNAPPRGPFSATSCGFCFGRCNFMVRPRRHAPSSSSPLHFFISLFTSLLSRPSCPRSGAVALSPLYHVLWGSQLPWRRDAPAILGRVEGERSWDLPPTATESVALKVGPPTPVEP